MDATRRQPERFAEGTGQSAKAQKSLNNGAPGLGSTHTNTAQGIADAWAHYAEDIMRNTSEATQALLRARTLPDLLGAHSNLLRNNMQAFLQQTARLAQVATRMASGLFDTHSAVPRASYFLPAFVLLLLDNAALVPAESRVSSMRRASGRPRSTRRCPPARSRG